jgi:LacI family transcriptional regulator
LRCLSDMGISIPNKIALIGFDDFDLASVVKPSLTTVAQSPVDLARRSMHLLLDRVRNRAADGLYEPAKIMLPVRLILRDSCGVHPNPADES